MINRKLLFLTIFVLILSKSVLSQQLVSVSATKLDPGTQAGYTFVVETNQSIAPNAEFIIAFPSSFLLPNVKMTASKQMNGGLSVSSVNDSTVLVKRSGLGETIAAGQSVDIFLASVINPDVMNSEFIFEIVHQENNQELSAIRSPHQIDSIQ